MTKNVRVSSANLCTPKYRRGVGIRVRGGGEGFPLEGKEWGLVGSEVQWLGCRSLAGRFSLPYTQFTADRWVNCPLRVSQLSLLSLPGRQISSDYINYGDGN